MAEKTEQRRIAVIGGGAGGMMAAGKAAESGAQVVIFEKNHSLGKKLLITGKGRCNVTNACSPEQMLQNVPHNPRFLFSAVNRFTPQDTIAFFEGQGCPLKVERGNRVFPVSDRSADILGAMKRYLHKTGVVIKESEVKGITFSQSDGEKRITGILTQNGAQEFDRVIIATGGRSYPGTGSTGDGYRFAKAMGHTVIPIVPSLVPLHVAEPWCPQLQGLSLKNCALRVKLGEHGKTVYEDFGEMLFTHFGVSGPMILSASAHLEATQIGEYVLFIDFKPALDEKALDKRLLNDFGEDINKNFSNVLGGLLPHKMIDVMISSSGISPFKKVHDITKGEREGLVQLMKNFPLHVTDFCPIAQAIVTSGGVYVKEINPKTMESKLVSGLYFAGEVIDVDAYTGGFNLQIAFATGVCAGQSAAQE